MMPGKDLARVEPNAFVRFDGGRRSHREPSHRIGLSVPLPRNTLDVRYRFCSDHHLACVCREAEQQEMLTEFRMEREDIGRTFYKELWGHPTVDVHAERDEDEQVCQCSGCKIARQTYIFPRWVFDFEAQQKAKRRDQVNRDLARTRRMQEERALNERADLVLGRAECSYHQLPKWAAWVPGALGREEYLVGVCDACERDEPPVEGYDENVPF